MNHILSFISVLGDITDMPYYFSGIWMKFVNICWGACAQIIFLIGSMIRKSWKPAI